MKNDRERKESKRMCLLCKQTRKRAPSAFLLPSSSCICICTMFYWHIDHGVCMFVCMFIRATWKDALLEKKVIEWIYGSSHLKSWHTENIIIDNSHWITILFFFLWSNTYLFIYLNYSFHLGSIPSIEIEILSNVYYGLIKEELVTFTIRLHMRI